MVRTRALSGWVRLGIVIAAPLCFGAGFMQYEGDRRIYEFYDHTPENEKAVEAIIARDSVPPPARKQIEGRPPSFEIMRTPEQIRSHAFWDVVRREVDVTRCSAPPQAQPSMNGYYNISCPAYPDVGRLLMVSALPAGIIFGIGWIIGWVWRGFRPSKE